MDEDLHVITTLTLIKAHNFKSKKIMQTIEHKHLMHLTKKLLKINQTHKI